MHIVEYRLEHDAADPAAMLTEASPADGALVHDILWAHADFESAVEHIRCRTGPQGIEITFLLAESCPDPVWCAAQVIDRAGTASRFLRDWRVVRGL